MRSHHLFLALVTVPVVGFLVFAPIDTVILLVSDDAYYYLNVARNHSLGNGFTFDGMHPSNGWHPAWMVFVQSVFQLLDSREAALRAVLLIQAGFAAGAVYILFTLVNRLTGSRLNGLTASALLLIMAPFSVLLLNGLETTLVLLVGLVLIHVLVINLERDTSRLRLLTGALLGLLFLSRLDSAFVVLALSVWILVYEFSRGQSFWQIIVRWAPGAILAGVMACSYFAWSYIEFGSPVPISGALKSTFPDPHFRIGFLSRVPHYTLGLVLAIAWLAWRARAGAERWQGIVLAIGLGCVVHLSWSIVFMAWGTLQWHFIAYVPVIVLAAADFIAAVGRGERLLLVGAVVGALLVNAGATVLKWGHHTERLAAAHWASTNLPLQARIGLRDAGIFGYFSEQQVVNLDGLINGFAFQEAIHGGMIESFLLASDVEYVADAYVPCSYDKFGVQIVAFSQSMPRRLIGEIRQFDPEAELYRQPVSKLFEEISGDDICFVIWQGRGTVKTLR